jgi:hypothetical protein
MVALPNSHRQVPRIGRTGYGTSNANHLPDTPVANCHGTKFFQFAEAVRGRAFDKYLHYSSAWDIFSEAGDVLVGESEIP